MEANNMAAIREALENSNGLLEELAAIGEWGESAQEQIEENNAAISAPPRNCDVGTPEEQEKRFENYTAKHWHLGKTAFQWAQMPYEEGGKI